MACVACLKHLILDYEFGCGFFLFGSFNQVSKMLGMFMLFAFGLNVLYSGRFSRCLIWCMCCLRGRSKELKNGFCSSMVLDATIGLLESSKKSYEPSIDKIGEGIEELNPSTEPQFDEINVDSVEDYKTDNNGDCEREYTCEHSDDEDINAYYDEESDVSTLKKLIKIERHRSNAARAELAKERASSATAAEEAMAMILRLQNEKSLIELESSQYRRLSEEKQIHDQEVIRSLQWLVWRHESERSFLEDQLRLYRQKLTRLLKNAGREEVEEAESSFNGGSIWDAHENVQYSSGEASLSPAE